MFSTWINVKDGNPIAYALFKRHYTFRPSSRKKQIAGPGQKLVLLTPLSDALFVWRKFIDDSGQSGVNCAVFRNESRQLSSHLIREAMTIAWERWPGERLYTYVNPRKIRSSNPGYCFLSAGWRRCGVTRKRKLIILEALPCSISTIGR